MDDSGVDQERKRFSGAGKKPAFSKYSSVIAHNSRRRFEKKQASRFQLLVRIDDTLSSGKALRFNKDEQQIVATAASHEVRPDKIEQGKRLLHCSAAELKEKLNKAMDRILENLSNCGQIV
jgi:hypothetical protein